MGKYELDLSDVAKVVMPDPNRLPLEGNRDRLVHVAFDLFRLKGDNTEDLWQTQADDDGNEFLVRTYSLPEEEQQIVQASDWRVVSDGKGNNLTVLYRNIPIHRLATADTNASTAADVELLRQTVQEKLSTDDTFVSKFIDSIPEEKRDLLSTAGFFDIFKRKSHPAVHTLMKIYRDLFPGDSEKSLDRMEKKLDELFWKDQKEFSRRAKEIMEMWKMRLEREQRGEQGNRDVARRGLESRRIQDKIEFDTERAMEQERSMTSSRADDDLLGISRELRKERKTKERKKTETEKDIAKILKEVSTLAGKKEQHIEESDITDPEVVMEKTIPESSKEVGEDIWLMDPEQREELERALKDIESPDVMTSARSSKARLSLSKRAENVEADPLLQKLETVNKMLGDVLSEDEEEEI
jgi:hypothetical protein